MAIPLIVHCIVLYALRYSALYSALCTPLPGKPQAMTPWSIIMLRLL